MSARAPRYAVGIDLGTSNSALADVDLAVQPAGPGEPLPGPMPLEIPQLAAPFELATAELLPSFIYLPAAHEISPGAFALPWDESRNFALGRYARERGAQVPSRLVSSAKSWLSHPGVDRRSALLPSPGQQDADVPRISPVEASARILRHLREAWEAAHSYEQEEDGSPMLLSTQAVTLTVPASFDPQARELTVMAAQQAGLPNITLLEEPQAALYAWVQGAGDGWRAQVKPGDVILVVDVGGGTSDFSLIGVGEEKGNLALERLAVGDHILLGGDNIDLALAMRASQLFAAQGTKLDSWQLQALAFAARQLKEDQARFVPGESGALEAQLAIPGRGSGMLSGMLRAQVTRAQFDETVAAFFPDVPADAQPVAARRGGLSALGLPYAQDPAVTRHLAAFLRKNARGKPTAVLFNGGVFKDAALRDRVAELVSRWTGAQLTRLEAQSLDLSVALGAAYSGLARSGRGIRIRGGIAHSYYVGVEASAPAIPGFAPPMRAICLAPFGLEEGSAAELPQLELGALVGETTSFRFFSSDERREDAAGAVVEDASELLELSPIEATLPAEGAAPGAIVPVGLAARVTEVGTLALELVAHEPPPRRWKLEFSVRAQGE